MVRKGPLIPLREWISPDPLGYGATQQIGRKLTRIYPTLGLGPVHVPQRSDFFPHGRDLAGFEPRTFRFQGFSFRSRSFHLLKEQNH